MSFHCQLDMEGREKVIEFLKLIVKFNLCSLIFLKLLKHVKVRHEDNSCSSLRFTIINLRLSQLEHDRRRHVVDNDITIIAILAVTHDLGKGYCRGIESRRASPNWLGTST